MSTRKLSLAGLMEAFGGQVKEYNTTSPDKTRGFDVFVRANNVASLLDEATIIVELGFVAKVGDLGLIPASFSRQFSDMAGADGYVFMFTIGRDRVAD